MNWNELKDFCNSLDEKQLQVKSTPKLIGKYAEIFIKKADFARAGSVDFTEQIEISRQIIDKAIKTNKSMKMTYKEMRDTVITI